MALAALAACGGGDDGAATTTTTTAPLDPRDALEAPAAGDGVAVLGPQELRFTVTCEEGAGPGDTAEATRELEVRGEGTGGDGPFTVEVTRYRSEAAGAVVTETARITFGEGDEARGAQAQRTTAGPGGAWLDLADPEADTPLISRTGAAVDVRGTFGPRGAVAGDAGLVPGRIRATCP